MNALVFSDSFTQFLNKTCWSNPISTALCRYNASIRYSDPYSGNSRDTINKYAAKRKMWEAKAITTEAINFITFRTDGTLSYLPAGKEHKTNEAGDWSKDGRQNGKPGKIIRKLFTDRAQKLFSDKDYETFGNQYKTHFSSGELNFDLLENDEIPTIYASTPRADGGHSLNSSCMHGEYSSYFDIYRNCDSLQILVLWDKNQVLSGRALVWSLEYDGEPITLMDRVYTAQPYQEEAFFEYARNAGWWRKKQQCYSNKQDFVTADGTLKHGVYFRVNTDTDFSNYPYIDTFSYGGDGYLENENNGPYEYTNTGGTRDGDRPMVWDELNEEDIFEDDAAYIDKGTYAGCWIHEDNAVWVAGRRYWEEDEAIVRDADGDYILREDAAYCEKDDEYYLETECVYSEYDSATYHRRYCVHSEQGWILQEDATEVDGVWYHDNEVPEDEEEEEYTITVSDGQFSIEF